MNELSIKKSNMLLIILDYIKEEGYEKSFISLEQESGISLFEYPKEISFLRNLIINGQWSNVEEFILPMKDVLGQKLYNNCLFELKKQIFMEHVEKDNSKVEDLVVMLNELQTLATDNESFMNLVLFLSAESEIELNLKPSRVKCFENLRIILSELFPYYIEERKIQKNTFIKLLNEINIENFLKNNNSKIIEKIESKQNVLYKNKKNDLFMINDLISGDTQNKDNLLKLEKLNKSLNINNLNDLIKKTNEFTNTFNNNSQINKENTIEKLDLKNQTNLSELDQKPNLDIYEDSDKVILLNNSNLNEINNNIDFNDRMIETEDFKNNSKSSNLESFNNFNNNIINNNKNSFNNFSNSINIARNDNGNELEDLDVNSKKKYENYQYNINNFFAKVRIKDIKPIRTGCFSPNGDLMAIGTNLSSIKIFDIKSIISQIEIINKYKYQNENIKSQEISQLIDIEKHHNGSIYCMDWSCSGKLIATGSNDQLVKCLVVPNFDDFVDEGKLELTMVGHKGIIRAICFDPNNELSLLSGGQKESNIKVWDSEEGKIKMLLEGHSKDINTIRWSNNGIFCGSSGDDKTIRFWDLRTNKAINIISALKFDKINDISILSSDKFVSL